MSHSLSRTDEALLVLLRRAIGTSKASVKLTHDEWKELSQASYAHAVVPLALDGTAGISKSIPRDVLLAWQTLAARLQIQNEGLWIAQDRLLALLKAKKIPAVILKGTTVAVNYPNPALRTMGDVDFLITPSQKQSCMEYLLANGFTYKGEAGQSHHAALYDENGVLFELHTDINGIPEIHSIAEVRLRSILARTLDSTVSREFEGHVFPAPSSLLQSVILLLHTASHLSHDGVGLRHLLDFGLFIEKELKGQPSANMLAAWEQCGLLRFARVLAMTASRAFALPVREWFASVDTAQADEMLADFIAGGNLGKERRRREMAGLLMTGRAAVASGKQPVSKRIWKNVISSTKKHYPIVIDYPILLTVALPCNLIKFGWRLCITGQLFRTGSALKHSKKRLTLIDSLALYDAKSTSGKKKRAKSGKR